MSSMYRDVAKCVVTFSVILAGRTAALAQAMPGTPPATVPVQVISIGQTVRVTGLITVEPDPAPIGYPGPILTDLETRLFERVSPGAAPRPITQLLLLFTSPVPPTGTRAPVQGTAPAIQAADAPTIYRVTVIGRYVRLIGAPSLAVTSAVVEGQVPPPPASGATDEARHRRFDALHARGARP